MAILTREILDNIGITLSDSEYTELSKHVETTLQQRVIEEVVAGLTPEQAKELADMQSSANDNEVYAWLQVNVTDFADIVSDEVDILLGEIAENSDVISSDDA